MPTPQFLIDIFMYNKNFLKTTRKALRHEDIINFATQIKIERVKIAKDKVSLSGLCLILCG